MEYDISRYESQGDSLFICISSTNNPVYIEHFFTEEEKLDIEGTIAHLVAELEIKDEAYVAPLPRVSLLDEAKALTIDTKKIASDKVAILAAKAVELEPVVKEEIVLTEEK